MNRAIKMIIQRMDDELGRNNSGVAISRRRQTVMIWKEGIFGWANIAALNKFFCVPEKDMASEKVALFGRRATPMSQMFSIFRVFHKNFLPKLIIKVGGDISNLTSENGMGNAAFGVDHDIEEIGNI